MNVDDIPIVEKASGFDPSKYEGFRIKIASINEIEVIDFYPDGLTYNPNSTLKTKKLEITTEPLKELDESGKPTEKDLEFEKDGIKHKKTISARFGLQEVSENEKINYVISKHPKAKLWAFMRKIGVQKPSEFVGKYVTITVVPSTNPNDDRKYLRIAQ